MRYLVKAKVKPGKEKALLEAIESGRLGQGSVAGDEYLDDMQKARLSEPPMLQRNEYFGSIGFRSARFLLAQLDRLVKCRLSFRTTGSIPLGKRENLVWLSVGCALKRSPLIRA